MSGHDQLRVAGQAQVIVGAHVQHLTPTRDGYEGLLSRPKKALALIRAGLANAVQLGCEVLLHGTVHESALVPGEYDLPGLAGKHGVKTGLKFGVMKAVRDHGADVEP